MFADYLRKILPIPILEIQTNKDGYQCVITTYSSVIQEYGVEKLINKIISKNKRIKSFDGWFFKPQDVFLKEAIVTFRGKNENSNN